MVYQSDSLPEEGLITLFLGEIAQEGLSAFLDALISYLFLFFSVKLCCIDYTIKFSYNL